MFTFVYFTLLHNIYCLQRCTASMQRSFLSVRAHSFLYGCILIVCVSQNPENIHNRWENSEFLQQIFGEVVHNNILYVLSMSNLKQIFLPFPVKRSFILSYNLSVGTSCKYIQISQQNIASREISRVYYCKTNVLQRFMYIWIYIVRKQDTYFHLNCVCVDI